ncbi:MAG: thiamine-phosphate kinase [Leptolyngbyaceae cyanobacterium T60_A2020_046]|nr:thiamine-phosphate kinase [Leptolyngbyaceae cyanobacterium T60_A2020_046]
MGETVQNWHDPVGAKGLTIADVGELGLLARLQRFCAPGMVGDDAAVLAGLGEESWVVTTDVLVDGVHFSDRTTSPADVGWRAIAANLSDLAAMGATPVGVTVGLSLPSHVAVPWVEAMYEGMIACLQTHGGQIIGGDICRAPHIIVAITALGRVEPQAVIRRDRAQPGHVLLATGWHGASRAGLELLLNPAVGHGLSQPDQEALIAAHQRPQPRLDVLPHLHRAFAETGLDFEVAGMDSSDGLANAVVLLCQASGVGARLVRDRVPLPPAFRAWLDDATALDWALYGGEDFELVLSLPPEVAIAVAAQLGPAAAIVGTLEAEPAVLLVESSEATTGIPLTCDKGFQHF